MDEIRVGNLRVVLDPAPFRASFDAVVVVLFAGERLVLVKDEGRAWEFPGGHREGHESCEETAAREVLEEAGFHIRDLRYLGYYATPSGLVTLITCAELASLEGRGREVGPSRVGLFDELPEALSFGDGREGLFLDCALRLKASRSEDGGWVARSY